MITVRRPGRRHGRKFRIHKSHWIDPFPAIPGTEPEKRLFAALVQRGIFFAFQDDLPELKHGPWLTLARVDFAPDFIIPEYKVILDPFSEFHHSLPDAIARDARKAVIYAALGYKFYHPWSDEVARRGGLAILGDIPELFGKPKVKVKDLPEKWQKAKKFPGYYLGPNLGLGATSVAAANRKRRKPHGLQIR